MRPELSNRVTLDQLRHVIVGEIAALPPEALLLLQQEAEAALKTAKELKDRLDGGIDVKYRDYAARLRREAGKHTGTVRLEDGELVVVAELPKRVKWDQPRLAALVEVIRAAGDDPADYVTVELKVAERAFEAWAPAVRDAFASARTVETGKPVYRIEPKKEPR